MVNTCFVPGCKPSWRSEIKELKSQGKKLLYLKYQHCAVADVMKTYQAEGHRDFQDSEPTIKFVERMNRVAQVMNSRRPWDSLYADKDSPSNKELDNFLKYLNNWENCCPDPEGKFTKETHLGLKVTIKGALELIEYLSKEVGYTFLMTRRINQDALEHFYGHVRQACGANQHPDPMQFIQVYHLLSCYSLIKPPQGSNVSGAEMIQSLLSVEDTTGENAKTTRETFEEKLDKILDGGDITAFRCILDHSYGQSTQDAKEERIDVIALSYFAGYVARRAKEYSTAKSCKLCIELLLASPEAEKEEEDRLIVLRSKGSLFTLSKNLKNLLYYLETAIFNTVKRQKSGKMHRHLVLEVLDEVSSMDITIRVRCQEHWHILTKWVMHFFLRTRMIFTCKDFVKTMEKEKKNSKNKV